MKVFLTGGTGFVGREVLRQLHAAGHTVRVLARDAISVTPRLPHPSCVQEIHEGDATDLRSLTGATGGCDAVIHLVGIISEAGRVTFERLHVDATRNIIAASQASGVKRFIHMSALGTRPDGVSRYHKTKWAAEEVVRRSGVDFTVFRPSMIYGPEDHFVNLFARMSRWSPALPLIGGGRSLMQPVTVEDVARCFVGALNRSDAAGLTLDVCGPERLSLEQIVRTILAVLRRKRLLVRVPMSVARVQACLLEFALGRLLRRPPPLNRDQLLMLEEDNVGEPDQAERLFALEQPRFENGITRYLRR